MIDSCRLRKLDPGLAATYSIPSALMTSTMKSEPGRSITVALKGTLPLVVAVWAVGMTAVWASAELASIEVPTAAAPATATPRRKSRLLVAICLDAPSRKRDCRPLDWSSGWARVWLASLALGLAALASRVEGRYVLVDVSRPLDLSTARRPGSGHNSPDGCSSARPADPDGLGRGPAGDRSGLVRRGPQRPVRLDHAHHPVRHGDRLDGQLHRQ